MKSSTIWKQFSLPKLAHRKRLLILFFILLVAFILLGLFIFQNHQATAALQKAKKLDDGGNYTAAKTTLQEVSTVLVTPGTSKQLQNEQTRNTQLLETQQKLTEAKKLLAEHKTSEALKILGSIKGGSSATNEVTSLQQSATSQAKNSSTRTGSTATSSGGGPTGGTGTGTGTGSGGGDTPPPGPMTAITVNSFSVTESPATSTKCTLHESVNFSVNGSGSVQVTWKELSTKTASAIENPTTYSFSAAGSQSDTGPGSGSWQGLETGDSYRVSVTITDSNNNSVTTAAGPTTISSCAAPQPLLSPSQQSFMSSSVTLNSLTGSNWADSLFVNECNINLQGAFSVSGPGSVQAVYTITSASSGGATLYASTQWSFSGPGSATDSSYIRMPHLASGDHYTVSIMLNVLGDPAHSTSGGSFVTGCS